MDRVAPLSLFTHLRPLRKAIVISVRCSGIVPIINSNSKKAKTIKSRWLKIGHGLNNMISCRAFFFLSWIGFGLLLLTALRFLDYSGNSSSINAASVFLKIQPWKNIRYQRGDTVHNITKKIILEMIWLMCRVIDWQFLISSLISARMFDFKLSISFTK